MTVTYTTPLIWRNSPPTPRAVGHIFGRDELAWRGAELQLGRRKLAQIEPDAAWPNMWRVRASDGRLSNMINASRARDAARALALAALNRKRKETPSEAPPIARNETFFAECGMSTPRAAKRLRRTTVKAMIVVVEG
jgi:hypothetical protein